MRWLGELADLFVNFVIGTVLLYVIASGLFALWETPWR